MSSSACTSALATGLLAGAALGYTACYYLMTGGLAGITSLPCGSGGKPVKKVAPAAATSRPASSTPVDPDVPKMVLVVRRDLAMGRGKTAAQACHACLGLYKKLRHRKDPVVKAWEASGATKVCLRAEGEADLLALAKAAAARGVATHMVVDAGRTQVAPDSRTVLALLAEGREVDAITGSLKLL